MNDASPEMHRSKCVPDLVYFEPLPGSAIQCLGLDPRPPCEPCGSRQGLVRMGKNLRRWAMAPAVAASRSGGKNSSLPFSGPVLVVPAQPSPASQPRTGTEAAKRVQAVGHSLGPGERIHFIAQATRLSNPRRSTFCHLTHSCALLCSAPPVSLRSDTRLDVCASPSYHIRSGIVALPTASLILIFFY
jgi:hypothetical protein